MIHAGANQCGSKEPRPSGRGLGLRRGLLGGSSRLYVLASVDRDYASKLRRFCMSMLGFLIRRVNTQYFALVCLFTLCQVSGTMCALPDLSVAAGATLFVEEGMACPMDGAAMCPPSLPSSPERQIKHSMVSDVDHAPILLGSSPALISPSVLASWSWSSVLSIVPISISSSSVLRI